jgi:hypothetical protein
MREDSASFRWTIIAVLLLLVIESLMDIRRLLSPRGLFIIQIIAMGTLLIPYAAAIFSAQRLPSQPQKVWSVVLQPKTWQAMNTGSEYGATRQLIFAGDRVVVVFDAGMAPYQGNQPMSTYRLLSLDQATGVIKDQ